LANMII